MFAGHCRPPPPPPPQANRKGIEVLQLFCDVQGWRLSNHFLRLRQVGVMKLLLRGKAGGLARAGSFNI